MSRVAQTCSLLCIALLVSSCSYFEFTMQEHTGWPVQTRILNDRHAVTRPASNAVHLDGAARIGMRCLQITDGIFTTEVKLSIGSTLRLQARTTPYDDSTAFHRGLVIDIANGLTTVMVNGTSTQATTPLPESRPFLVELVNDGQWTRVVVACVTVGRFSNITPSTQWIIASLPAGGSALIADPYFEPLYSSN